MSVQTRETVRSGPALAVGEYQIRVVSRLSLETHAERGAVAALARKAPVAVLISGPDGERRFDLDGPGGDRDEAS